MKIPFLPEVFRKSLSYHTIFCCFHLFLALLITYRLSTMSFVLSSHENVKIPKLLFLRGSFKVLSTLCITLIFSWIESDSRFYRFLGVFVKLQNVITISSCRLSTCRQQLGSSWTDFHSIWYLCIFWKFVGKIQVSLKSEKNNRYFMCRTMYFCDSGLLNSSLNEKYFGQNLYRKSSSSSSSIALQMW